MAEVIIITGHYGSGKTTVAVNLALAAADRGKVTAVDLDIVNPYFRTADFETLFQEHDITLVASQYANSNLDIPALGFDLQHLLSGEGTVIIDVGGDDAGALALGRYAAQLNAAENITMYYVINRYRYLTKEPQEALALLREIERAGKISAFAIINNSNLGTDTTALDVKESLPFAREVAELAGLPLAFTAVRSDIAQQLTREKDIMPIGIYVKPIWSN